MEGNMGTGYQNYIKSAKEGIEVHVHLWWNNDTGYTELCILEIHPANQNSQLDKNNSRQLV